MKKDNDEVLAGKIACTARSSCRPAGADLHDESSAFGACSNRCGKKSAPRTTGTYSTMAPRRLTSWIFERSGCGGEALRWRIRRCIVGA
jgi:hypothetical protein